MHDEILDFKSAPPKKLLIGVAAGIVAVVVIAAVIVGVVLSSYTPFQLPPSAPGELLRLARTDAVRTNGENPIVARSYDGNPWELVPDQDFAPIQLDCKATSCVVLTRGKYAVKKVDIPQDIITTTNEEKWARFLMQSTFGANKAELQAAATGYGSNYMKWIRDQMALPATELRTYYRQRTAPRYEVSNQVGAIFQPCEIGSRWHRFAFEVADEGLQLVVSNSDAPSAFTLRIGAVVRTEVPTFINFPFPSNNITNITFPATFTICRVTETNNGSVTLSRVIPGVNSTTCNWTLRNPPISFTTPDPRFTRILSDTEASFVDVQGRPDLKILTRLNLANCSFNVINAFAGFRGEFYRFDSRLKLIQNTLTSPADASGSQTCPAVVKTFLNAQNCLQRASCAPLTFSSAPVTLNTATLRSWYTENQRYVYFVTGLRLEAPYAVSPCGRTSRWLRINGTCPSLTTNLDAMTLATITNALSNSTDPNPFVRDITLAAANCTAGSGIGAQIQVGAECFQHVHPDLYTVRDFSYWKLYHDGNMAATAANRPNPIAKWAVSGSVNLPYPTVPFHDMTRWFDKQRFFPLVGRFGDVVDFRSLTTDLQTVTMAQRVNAIASRSDQGFQACGSPGEAANDPTLGHRYQWPDLANQITGNTKLRELDWPMDFNTGKTTIWTNVVLKSPDQLRHRVAWALAQIVTLSTSGIDRNDENEPWVNYYDIFVRNAFGNYRDILREVSYNPMMSFYLSYYQNRAYAVANTYPDENYAREIMQLFSIGLWKLNDDGTEQLDSDGNPIPTYTNDDIIDFARLWTGFDIQQPRSNIEQRQGAGSANVMDPLQIKPIWRDLLPKAKLDSGFLGDRYPLCDELPAQHWLTEGARFVLTGDVSIEGRTVDSEAPNTGGLRGRFAPVPGRSALYQALCAPVAGRCTFPPEVVLDRNLQCDGKECSAGRVIAVKIVDPAANATKYYTYISVPCVRLTFFDQGKVTLTGGSRQCANPTHAVAQPVCCVFNRSTTVVENNTRHCLFVNEATNYDTAVSRCLAANYSMCNVNFTQGATWLRTCADSQFQWINANCTLQIQIYGNGQIAIVDPIVTNGGFRVLRQNTNNVFRVRWAGDKYPRAEVGCAPGCRIVTNVLGDTCLCNVSVQDEAVFTDNTKLPSRKEVLAKLPVGAARISSFGTEYTKCTSSACNARSDVTVWLKNGNPEWDTTTIFEVDPIRAGGAQIFLKNFRSTVFVEEFSFRNPPHFMPLTGEQTNSLQWASDAQWLPRAQQEVEALLDHLFEHDSTAPFISYRLIQRLVTSNPSPRYVTSVVNAFRTGYYNGEKFSGRYGDLAATVAAILLDREARSTVIEADPTFGLLREPLLKVLHVLRALEFRTYDTRETQLIGLNGRLGMEPFNAPTVFGFYLPENRPAGAIIESGLVAPEFQIATPPAMIGYLNSIVSLIDGGLTSCSSGFGYNFGRTCSNLATQTATADGILNWAPAPGATAAQVVDELDLLLTGGRLNPELREYFISQYASLAAVNATTAAATAMKFTQKLFVTAPEFHTTGANILKNETRDDTPLVTSKGRKYKAIVILFQGGGCDSFNMLVPHSNCPNRDLYSEYQTVRTIAALDKSMLIPLEVPTGTQPCDTFGLHSSMPNLAGMYNSKDALFLANIGALVEPITKSDWNRTSGLTKRYPPSLFAHNIMTRNSVSLHPQNAAAQGVLGRIVAALSRQAEPWKSDLYSLIGTTKLLDGASQSPDYVDPNGGVTRFSQYRQFADDFDTMTASRSESVYSETYARLLQHSIKKTEALGAMLQNTTLNTTFGTDFVSRQFQQISKLIKIRTQLQTERAVFVAQRGGYDTHGTFDMTALFGDVDAGLGSFAAEMKAQGVWDDVVVMTISEFGRTLTANGAGTDHAWAGNHFIAGGAVKGGRILGEYPNTLFDFGEFSLGRGRVLPTTSWEAAWKGLAQWFGVKDSQLPYVLPNIGNFPANKLYSKEDLFNPPY